MRRASAPFVAWALGTGVLVATAAAAGWSPARAGTWLRYDSGLYLDVAQHGYTLFHCPSKAYGTWCGNAGWFPAYPWLVRAVHLVVPDVARAAVVVSWTFTLATLVLLWATFLERRATPIVLAVLAYAAFAPGQVYLYAAFPLSLLAFATVLHLWLLSRGRWLLAGLAGALAALAYPVGVMVAVAAAVWLLAVRRPGMRASSLVLGPIAVALFGLMLDQRLETGHWDAYLLVQDKYHHGLRDPFAPVGHALGALVHGHLHAPDLQTLLVTLVLVLALGSLGVGERRPSRAELLVAIWAVAAWVFPHAQTHVSVYRSEAALLPLAILLRRLPWPLVLALALAAAALSVPMARLFLAHKLV